MNAAYQTVIAASDEERRDLFLAAANRIGTTIQNIEKDFWVCWTLDVLFHRLEPGGPRLLFKGGTSLSKGYGLISRFSEDIDVTVFRKDIGADASIQDLEALSKKKRDARLDEIKTACQTYIDGKLRIELIELAREAMEAADKDPKNLKVVLDEDDNDKQSLLIHYPSVVEASGYIFPSVKIESGAKSALDPNQDCTITPYLAPDLKGSGSLVVPNVTTIYPQRTFMDKILILHGMVHFFEEKGILRGNGRMSRHYYDVHRLMSETVGKEICSEEGLIEDCIRHAQLFFYRRYTGLETAKRGTFRLRPTEAMLDPLQRDFEAMSPMIFDDVPTFKAVLDSIDRAEELLNEST